MQVNLQFTTTLLRPRQVMNGRTALRNPAMDMFRWSAWGLSLRELELNN